MHDQDCRQGLGDLPDGDPYGLRRRPVSGYGGTGDYDSGEPGGTLVAKGFKEGDMELSQTKSACSASTKELATTLRDDWEKGEEPILIQVQMNKKSLGTGLGAGRRRNVAYLN